MKDVRNPRPFSLIVSAVNRRLDEWVPRDRVRADSSVRAPAPSADPQSDGRADDARTRHQRRRHNEINHVQKGYDEMDPTTAALEREHEQLTKVKYVNKVTLGRFKIDTWYFSPYPAEFGRAAHLFVCEFCCKYMRLERTYRAHLVGGRTR